MKRSLVKGAGRLKRGATMMIIIVSGGVIVAVTPAKTFDPIVQLIKGIFEEMKESFLFQSPLGSTLPVEEEPCSLV